MCDRVNECEIVKELRKQVEILTARVKVLEEKLEKYEKPPKDSSNSSMPPSLDKRKYPKREKSDRKTGGQPGHKGTTRILADNPMRLYLFIRLNVRIAEV